MTDNDIRNMPAGRDLDALVAEKVMGWHLGICHWPAIPPYIAARVDKEESWLDAEGRYRQSAEPPEGYGHEDDEDFHLLHWHPSESIIQAWDILEKLDNPKLTRIDPFGLWRCESNGDTHYLGEGDTAPLAICRAALETRPNA